MRSFLLLVAAAVLSGESARSQTKPSARNSNPPGPLHSVTVKGNNLYPTAGIVKVSGLRPGERVSPALLDEARGRIYGTELFNNVAYEYRTGTNGYDVVFDVAENQQLFPIEFERLGENTTALRSCLKDHVDLYSARIPGTDGVLRRYAAAIQTCLASSMPGVKVKATISNFNPSQLTALFAPDRPAPAISLVQVTGNQAVDTGTILRAVNQVAIGVPLSDTRLKLILDGAIRPLYAAKGYPAVSFPKVESEPDKNNLGVVVKVEIKDGPPFKFGAIRFRGNGLEEEEIRSAIPFKPGAIYNSEQADNFRLDLIRKMKRRGLLDANITLGSEPDEEKHVVNMIYDVIPGSVYNFETLKLHGLDITTEPVVTKLWGEKPGHPFNPEYPDFFLKRLNEGGLFDNLADTHSEYDANADTHNVTVHLYFKGGESKDVKERKRRDRQSGGPGPQ